MDKFFHDDFEYKVNMGSRKDLDKKAIIEKNKREREKRMQVKLENESAEKLQKHIRRVLVNQKIAKDLVVGQKLKENVKAVEQLVVKMPQHCD